MIYFIQRGAGGPVKIGRAVEPEKRLRTLQTSSPEPLRLLLVISGGAARESEIHAAVAKSHLSGEWYHPTPEVFAAMEKVREPEFEVHGLRAYAVLRRRDARTPTSLCPFCGEPHLHGEPDGHRVAHCREPATPEIQTPGGITLRHKDGYYVRSYGSSGSRAV